jgi:ADP-ribose pyrophosphatase YjhB (NUDIX family)
VELNIINSVGIWFYAQQTNRYLYLIRNDSKHPGCWGLPGGKVEPGENLLDAITRECQEELSFMPPYVKIIPIEKFTSADQSFVYHTFWCALRKEFIPTLNHEHLGWAWIDSGTLPRPLHPGLWSTVNIQVIQEKIHMAERGWSS